MRIFPENFRRAALIAPAGPLAEVRFTAGLAALHATGLEIQLLPHAHNAASPQKYLAAGTAERVADLETAWLDTGADLLLAVRGGFGCAHLLPHLRWELLAAHPMLLGGYSDITSLHWAMVKFHAGTPVTMPMLGSFAELDSFTADGIRNALAAVPRKLADVRRLAGGDAIGLPLPGNLTVAATLSGTPYMPDVTGRILLLEEVGEPLYRIDRLLTQLEQNGLFERAAAVIFGSFTGTDVPEEQLTDLLASFARRWAIPCAMGFPFGHKLPMASINFSQSLELNGSGVWAR